MDEDLPHVTEALRGTVCVGVAFETAWKKNSDGTPMDCTRAENSGAPCYIYHYGSLAFSFTRLGFFLRASMCGEIAVGTSTRMMVCSSCVPTKAMGRPSTGAKPGKQKSSRTLQTGTLGILQASAT